MPRPPQLSPAAASIKGSVYSSVLHRLAAYEGEVYPLHVGDTFLEPRGGLPDGGLHGRRAPRDAPVRAAAGPPGARRRRRRSPPCPDRRPCREGERLRRGGRDVGPRVGRRGDRLAGRRGPDPGSALAAHRGAREDGRRRSRRRPVLRRGRIGRDGGRRRRGGPHVPYGRALRQHSEQPDGARHPARLARGARRPRPAARPLAPLRRGLRGLRLPGRARARASPSRPSAPSRSIPSRRPTAWRETASGTSPGPPRPSPKR